MACYELHTFSSLNKDFLPQYDQKLQDADVAVVFYSPHTLKMKNMPEISEEEIVKYFGRPDLIVITDSEELRKFLSEINWFQTNLLLMSSGTFGGTDLNALSAEILALPVEETFPEIKTAPKSKKWGGLLGNLKGKLKKDK